MTQFNQLLESALLTEKSITTVLNSQEQNTLVKVMVKPNAAQALQKMDGDTLFDKALKHLLGKRDSSTIKGKSEGEWMVNQLEFDNKFMKLVRSAR